MKQDLILIARVQGAFGVKGEVRIHAYTADPLALKAYKALLDKTGRLALTVTAARLAPNGVIVKCKEVADRDQAEALKGLELHVLRSALPEPEEGEFYVTDLVGLEVRALDGRPLGRIAAVENYGAGDLLDIRPLDGGPSWLLEFTRANVPSLDLTAGFITIAPAPETD